MTKETTTPPDFTERGCCSARDYWHDRAVEAERKLSKPSSASRNSDFAEQARQLVNELSNVCYPTWEPWIAAIASFASEAATVDVLAAIEDKEQQRDGRRT